MTVPSGITEENRASGSTSGPQDAERANARLAAIIEAAEDAIVATDLDGIVTDWNRGAETISGYSAAEMIGAPIFTITPDDRFDEEASILKRIACGEHIPHFESQRKTKDGRLIDVSVAISPILDGSGRVVGVSRIARDITAQKQRDRELNHLARLYSALSQVNQAIVLTTSREDLFKRVCDVLIVNAGFEMAWIGWLEESTRRIVPVCAAGRGTDRLSALISSAENESTGGPVGAALRTGEPWVCPNIEDDPALTSWRDVLREQGFSAMAAFPIRESSIARAVLVVCSSEPHFFRDREVALLEEAAGDLSFALTSLLEREERRGAEREAEAERQFSTAMVESMPGIFYFYDENFRFLRWNRNFEIVSGYTADEIRRMEPLDLFAEPEKHLVRKRIEEVFEKGESSVEASLIAKDGTATPYFFTGRRMTFNGATCLIGVGLDISEHRRSEALLRESDARYRTLFEYAPVGILIADAEACYLDANPGICKMLGYSRSELIGMRASQVVAPEELPNIEPALDAIQSTADYHREWTFQRKDGSTFPAAVNATVMPDGSILAMIRDISEQKAAEETMRRLNESLEEQVATRTKDLQAALLRAEAADRIKSAFLATMSHELRTPLNSIIGFTGILLQGLAGPLNAEQTKQLGMVRGSARHLLDLINDVLDLSKIEAGQLETRADVFNLREAIEHVGGLVQPLAEKKKLSLTVTVSDGLQEIESDRRRVEQILLNLLNNAIKFTERGGVALSADLIVDEGRPAVRLQVADTGIGIRAEDLGTLFQPFRQLDTGISRVHEGTGLGLAICRRLAALLGGRIFAESEPGRGSVFTLILPLQSPPPS